MRVSRAQAADNRNRVLAAAGRLFRERGLDGAGVAEIMSAAGLTHGGFYGQFASKDELVLEACARALNASAEKWEALQPKAGETALAALVASYLHQRHRDDPGTGCLLPTLSIDITRGTGAGRHLLTRGLTRLIDILARAVPSHSAAAKREAALATMAGLVGAIVLARAVDDAMLSDEILAAAAKALSREPIVPRPDR